MKTFTVVAFREIYVYDTIEAESFEDAYEQIHNGDYEVDWRNGENEDDIKIAEVI